VNLSRALNGAGIAGSAEPDGKTVERLLLETFAYHCDDPAGRVVHIVAQRAGRTAGAALDTAQQFLSVSAFGNPFAEMEIELRFIFNTTDNFFNSTAGGRTVLVLMFGGKKAYHPFSPLSMVLAQRSGRSAVLNATGLRIPTAHLLRYQKIISTVNRTTASEDA
jgi:hypothetical protein